MWLLIDEKLKGVKSTKFDSIESGESIRPASIVELGVDEKLEEVDASEHHIGHEHVVEWKEYFIVVYIDGSDDGIPLYEGIGGGDEGDDFADGE